MMAQRTHVEKRAPVQRRPRNLPLERQLREIRPDAYLRPGERLGQPRKLRAENVSDELVGEVELHAGGDRGVDDQFGWFVLRCAAGDAVDDCILAGEGFLEGVGGGVVDGFEGDV